MVLFDPDFFMYYEDTELSYRVQSLGFGVHFVPRAHIVHLHDMSPKERGTYNLNFGFICNTESLFVFKESYGGCGNEVAFVIA